MLGLFGEAVAELVDDAAEAVADCFVIGGRTRIGTDGKPFYSCMQLEAERWNRSTPAERVRDFPCFGSTDDAATGTIDPTPYLRPGAKGLVRLFRIPDDERGTVATLEWMAKLAREAASDPEFISWARAIVRDIGSKDYESELRRLLDYVKENVKYQLDPADVEWVSDPRHTLLVSGAEDCDGISALLVALALALGFGGGFVTYKADPRRSSEWSHVASFLAFRKGGKVWCGVADGTQKESVLGWEPSVGRYFGRKIWWVKQP